MIRCSDGSPINATVYDLGGPPEGFLGSWTPSPPPATGLPDGRMIQKVLLRTTDVDLVAGESVELAFLPDRFHRQIRAYWHLDPEPVVLMLTPVRLASR